MAADEPVDVVDADDRVVGRATRGEMRARRLRHRATYLLLFNGRGELFVHQRTPTKDVYPSHWDVAVGGVVGAGESYEEGARRELAEEVGIADVVPEALFDLRYEDARNQVNGRVFRVTWDGPLRLQAEEVVRGEWLPLTAVRQRMARDPFCPDGAAVLAEYLRRG
ncbi:NUDIX domain-containing protein [bacterium]|nr:NUDIX domain-containing protein [bacterium]